MLSSIRKRIEECSQYCSRLRLVSDNLDSLQQDEQTAKVEDQYRQEVFLVLYNEI